MNKKDTARQEAIETLKNNYNIKPGDTLYTVLRDVSRSGMSRKIDVFQIVDGSPQNISYLVAKVLQVSTDSNSGALKIGGVGMDMGFNTVYSLSRYLFRGDFVCIGDKCPSNDHSNGDRNHEPHLHSDAGYALRQQWM